MKKILSLTFIILFLAASINTANAAEFWASKNSNKYHYPTCKWAQKIKPSNLVKFNSPEEAKKAGKVPCKVCKPPELSKTENSTIRLACLKASKEEPRRGCCSHHDGVCGCSGGRALCCDGTLSPSCGCD